MFLFSLISMSFALDPNASMALKRGDCQSALLSLEDPKTELELLAAGKCQLKIGEYGAAADLLEQIPPGPYLPYGQLILAQSKLTMGDPQAALNILEKQDPSGPLKENLQLLKAQTLLKLKRYIEARDLLRPLLTKKRSAPGYRPSDGDIDPAEVRWLLAEGARLRGDHLAAIPVWWNIWTHNPESDFENRVIRRLIQYGERVPNPNTDDGRAQIQKRAQTLSKMYMFKEALALTDLLPRKEDPASRKKLAYDSFRAKDYQRAIDIFSELTSKSGEDLYHHALGYARLGKYEESSEIYTQLFKTYPGHARADIASYKIGYMLYDEGKYTQAIEALNEHLKRYPKSKHADEARWFIGWSLVKQEQYPEARKQLGTFLEHHPRSSLASGALFWIGYSYALEGNQEQANTYYKKVLRSWPLSGHAWYATQQLNISFPKRELATVPDTPDLLDKEAFHRGKALAQAGFEGWARMELSPFVAQVNGKKLESLVLAHTLIEAGDFTTAQKIARPYCSKPWKENDSLAIQACYPRPHGEALSTMLDEHGLNPNLPYAIMTAESALKPWVSSPAGARGLMQLMPEVGEKHHNALYPETLYDADDLFLAGYNAQLGTRELMLLFDRYENASLAPQASPLPLVIAGYNGGPEAVDRWLELFETPPSAEVFSESIGYTETRRYVRRVLGYLMAYNFVYGLD